MATGVSVSKAVTYAVLTPPVAVSISKANAYAVLEPPVGASVSKANAYAVLYDTTESKFWPVIMRLLDQ